MTVGREALERRIGEAGKWLLVGAFFFLPLNGLRQIAGVPIGDLFLFTALALAPVLFLVRRRLPLIPPWLLLAAVLFLGGFLISETTSSLDAGEVEELFPGGGDPALPALLKLLVSLLMVPFVVITFASRLATIRLLAAVWIAGVAVSCLGAVVDAYLGFGLGSFIAENREQAQGFIGLDPARYSGFAAHPNSLGISVVLATPLLLASITSQRRLFIGFPLLLLFFWGVLLSGSRASAVGFFSALIVALVLLPKVRSILFAPRLRQVAYQVTLVALFLTVAFSGLGGGAGGGFAAVQRLNSDDESASASDLERRELLESSFDLIAERPLGGNGFELIQSTHTVYLQPLLAGGLLALAGFVIAWAGFLLTGMRLCRTTSEPTRSLGIALMISIGSYLVMGVLINGMLDRFLYLAPALILALFVASAGRATGYSWSARTQAEKPVSPS